MLHYLRRNHIRFMAMAVALIALALYYPTLQLPIIYDTLLHIRVAKGLDLATLWLPTERFGFYRPLIFLPLILIRDLFGHYPSGLLHGLNVVQHALNAVLVFALAWRLWKTQAWALASGLLFAVFPFAYQAVAVNGHNVHVTMAGLVLLGLHTYLYGIRTCSTRWWALTTLFFLLGLLNHETATLFGPLAALVHWNDRRQISLPFLKRGEQSLSPWFLYFLVGGLYAVLYQLLPLSRVIPGAEAESGQWSKVLYLIQAATYPITWFRSLLPNLPTIPLILGGMGLALALTIWSAHRCSHRLPLLLGWGWWFGVSFLLFLTLPPSYLLHGPRLLYLVGVGLALLWPVLLAPLFSFKTGPLLWTLAVALLVLNGWIGVRGHLDRYHQLTSPINAVRKFMDHRPAGEGVLIVNLPSWIAPATNSFPVGVEHTALLGQHLFLDELIEVNLRTERPTLAIKLPESLSDPGYPYAITGGSDLSKQIPVDWAPLGSQVFVVSLGDQIHTHHAGQLLPGTGTDASASFGQYELLAADAQACDDQVRVTTRWAWSANPTPSPTHSLFVQLFDSGGILVDQADSPPLGLRFDLLAPRPDWQIVDQRVLESHAGESDYLLIGVYDYLDGQRMPAQDDQRRPLTDNALHIPLSHCLSQDELNW